ncbi:Nucleoporin nup84 [Ophidiomyces ophidiicola]|nr:Nucleoporin nup84 [Ophidiomyces ophidiicola]KAI1918857.1 Nucleoporin nup84 [Ophidiomyces ophidiicola]KAI1946257.1 Nucleoporin nup84 [Ophidiomyces ophidiicola]KAI2085737.1 Nucleoporin nup84 [Ophidiomyces ophidiicola]KAI2114422.1 Nucleoporin nup84 [Ophidiomyces ophidiicola]
MLFTNTCQGSAIPGDAEIVEIDDDSNEDVDDNISFSKEDVEMRAESEIDGDEDEAGNETEHESRRIEYEEDMAKSGSVDLHEIQEYDDEESCHYLRNSEGAEDVTEKDKVLNRISSIAQRVPNFGISNDDPISRASNFITSNIFSLGINQTLHPLQDIAERVLKQMESFALNLDQFRRQSPGANETQTFREACKLAKNYQLIAEKNVRDISKARSAKKPNKLASNKIEDKPLEGEVREQLTRWQLEAETWDLLHQLLSVADPVSREQARHAEKTVFHSLHRYSSDHEIWEQFLEADHFARENVIILQWLEKTASSTAELDTIISELEQEADRVQGLWAYGWLYTKETIKGAKRLRSWPQPLEPEDSRITSSLIGSAKRSPLITQLDPDAVIRQGLGLQKQDQFYEQAAWIKCWKMLRSGQSWSDIRAWSYERLESWRAMSVSGSNPMSKAGSAVDNGLGRMMCCRSQDSWRSACSFLANDSRADRYEKAVYALLCGETESAYAVCQSWGDLLYVFYNHLVLDRYGNFCQQFLRKFNSSADMNVFVKIDPPRHDDILKFLVGMKTDKRVAQEAKNPYRQIQAAILSRNFDHLFYHHANALLNIANAPNGSTLMPRIDPTMSVDDPVLIIANDQSSLRIIAHLYLLLSKVGIVRGDTYFCNIVAINVVRYIEFLRENGRTHLIPLYSSLLPRETGHTVLGKVLIDVTGGDERQNLVDRLRAIGVDLAAVLRSQWTWALSEADPDIQDHINIAGKFVERNSSPEGVCALPANIFGDDVSLQQERLIRCLEWHRFIGTDWPALCLNGAYLYTRFLRNGELSAARELYRRVHISSLPVPPEFSVISLSRNAEVWCNRQQLNGGGPISPRRSRRSMSPLKSAVQHQRQRSFFNPNAMNAEQLSLKMQIVEDLEALVKIFEAIETWGNLSNEYLQLSNPDGKRALQHQLQRAIDTVTDAVNPLCQDWLCQLANEERAELEMIRTAYLPEIILLYHNSLYFAGCTIGREVLAQCMTLAIAVAGSSSLTECFVSAGRMSELVRALAMSSMAVLAIKDPKLKKKLPRNATLGIWKIEPIEDDATGLTLLWRKD